MFRPIVIIIVFIAAMVNIGMGQTTDKPTDYSSLELAKVYQKEKNYVFAYKHLLIFKFTNLERLMKPQNKSVLVTLDKNIEEFEQLLKQNISWYDIKRSRGFSDKAMDSTFKAQSFKM